MKFIHDATTNDIYRFHAPRSMISIVSMSTTSAPPRPLAEKHHHLVKTGISMDWLNHAKITKNSG